MYYRRKLFALFHDPFLKALFTNKGETGSWQQLTCLFEVAQELEAWWKDPSNPEKGGIRADHISSASDRLSFRRDMQIDATVERAMTQIEVCHPITGAKQTLHFGDTYTDARLLEIDHRALWVQIRDLRGEKGAEKAFWWVWRFYGDAIASDQGINHRDALLLPAETRLPDCPIAVHNAMTSGLAGAMFPTGVNNDAAAGHPWLLMMSFSPVQEFIKASRKFLDFWAGSYLLHYLSARLCWYLAEKYGPDAILSSNLYGQTIIDAFLLQKYPDFAEYFDHLNLANPLQQFEKEAKKSETSISLTTAGFPNIISVLIPAGDRDTLGPELEKFLGDEWRAIGDKVRESIKKTVRELYQNESNVEKILDWISQAFPEGVQDPLTQEFLSWEQGGRWEWNRLWQAQLDHTWETYWIALPLGNPERDLVKKRSAADYSDWKAAQDCVAKAMNQRIKVPTETEERVYGSVNVGTWWPLLQQRLGDGLAALKSTRNWQIPVAPGERSSLSGQYSVVHPNWLYRDRFCEGGGLPTSSLRLFWKVMAVAFPGLFNGSERLNALELTKRMAWNHGDVAASLGVSLGETNGEDKNHTDKNYYEGLIRFPNLSAIAAARFMKDHPDLVKQYWRALNQAIAGQPDLRAFQSQIRSLVHRPNHIRQVDAALKNANGEHLNGVMFSAKWLGDDLALEGDALAQLRGCVDQAHRAIQRGDRSPADWWAIVLADGDSMGDYVRGEKLKPYGDYVPQQILDLIHQQAAKAGSTQAQWQRWQTLIQEKKRMGPATHVGLNRALLDFSNQIVPYLAEHRFCGRVIYSGGDDVMAVFPLGDVLPFIVSLRSAWCGQEDPGGEFEPVGDYWKPTGAAKEILGDRPHFTMGTGATLSMGIVMVHKSVPLPTVLEHLWQAEKERAKKLPGKDGLCFRVIYGSGNCLEALLKGHLFPDWWHLLEGCSGAVSPVLHRLATDIPQHCYPSADRLISQAIRAILSRRQIPLPTGFDEQLMAWCDRWEDWAMANSGALGTDLQDLMHLFRFSAFWLDHLDLSAIASDQEAAA